MAKRCSKISEGCFVIKYKINLRLVLSPLIKTTLVSCNENSRKIGSVVVARPGLMTQRIARSFSLSLSLGSFYQRWRSTYIRRKMLSRNNLPSLCECKIWIWQCGSLNEDIKKRFKLIFKKTHWKNVSFSIHSNDVKINLYE